MSQVVTGTAWQRISGREHVKVERVWYWPGQGWTVRAHPIRGGKVLIADQDWFVENYRLLAAAEPMRSVRWG